MRSMRWIDVALEMKKKKKKLLGLLMAILYQMSLKIQIWNPIADVRQ